MAIHGNYCGIHYKHPNPWQPTASPGRINRNNKRSIHTKRVINAAIKIQKFFKKAKGRYFVRSRGPAYFNRTVCVNDTDFFSTDKITDISGALFFSYKDSKKHIYGFDLRSIATLITNCDDDEKVENPFNRDIIPIDEIRKVQKLVRKRTAHGLTTEWAKLEPSTPIQQYRMKIVDLFQIIDNLNYYSSPDWFLNLTLAEHIKFYRQLYAIWTYRANLTTTQKRQIVPNYSNILFKYSPFMVGTFSLERIQKLNLNVIRTMITSAEDRNDRIIGAMYIISTLTLVSNSAREAYPWLYESVLTPEELGPEPINAPPQFFGLGGWLNEIFNLAPPHPPLLLLPPPQNTQ